MNKDSKIYIAGHTGMVGSAIVRRFEEEGYHNLVCRTIDELDLIEQHDVRRFFNEEHPEFVFLAAAKVGGIRANDAYRAQFIYENLQIQNNVIHASYQSRVKKLLFLGSSCIYPKQALQPIKEEYLLAGPLEHTNEPYAIAKIAGIKLCQAYNTQYGTNFISVMPTNLYGPNDNFDPETSHVFAALIRKFHEAKIHGHPSVEVWGTGKPRREFLHVDDLAGACLFLMKNYNDSEIINVGMGKDLTIAELAVLMKRSIGFEGDVVFNTTKPDGTLRKLLDVSKLRSMGWKPTISLEEGIKLTYGWFVEHR